MPCALPPREPGAVPTEERFHIVYILWGQTMTFGSKQGTYLFALFIFTPGQIMLASSTEVGLSSVIKKHGRMLMLCPFISLLHGKQS